jgi:RNA polymerase sigma-70 factor (ECF subfamily)
MNVLLERARAGEPVALRGLVELLRPRLLRMARYYALRAGEDPDDLLQEAWIAVLEALPELDLSIGTPHQYLVRRARWRILDILKRSRLHRLCTLDEATEPPAAEETDATLAAISVIQFLGRLKPAQRQVLGCLFVGLTWREAGERLGCTSANIAYHVRRIQRLYVDWRAEENAGLFSRPAAVGDKGSRGAGHTVPRKGGG